MNDPVADPAAESSPWANDPVVGEESAPAKTGTVEWNGMKADFEVPGDTTDKTAYNTAARAALVAKYPKRKFPPVQAFVLNDAGDHVSPDRSLGDYVNLGLRSVRHGLGDIIDLGASSLIPSTSGLFNAGMDAAVNKAAGPGPEPSTDNERLGDAAVRGATAGVIGGGPMSLGRTALMGISGATSGAFSESARQQGYGPGTQLAAGLVGGVLPISAAATAREIVGAVGTRLPGVSPAPRAAVTLREAAFNPEAAAANIRARPAPSPGTAPTLAEVAKDPGLAALQRSKHSTAIQEQQRANALARGNTVDQTAGPGNPGAVQDLAQQQAAEGTAGVTTAREGLGPQMDRADSGAQVRGQFSDASKASWNKVNEAYDTHRATVTAEPVTLTNQFHADLGDATKPFYGDGAAPMSSDLQAIIDDLRKPNATGERFGNIDRRLAEFSANVRRQGGSNTEAGAADQLRNVVEAYANDILPPEQVASLRQAKKLRAEHGQTFEQGNAAEAFRTKAFAEPVKDDVELPHALVKQNGTGGATVDRLTAAVGPEATEATIRAELRRVADEGQVQTPAQVQALTRKYGETIQRIPGLAADFQRLHDRAALNEAFLKSPLGRMSEGDPATAIGKVIFGDDAAAAAQLVNQIKGSPSALAGLRRSFAELIARASKGDAVTADGVNIPNATKSSQAIDMVLARSGKALTSQQRSILQQIKTEMDSVSYAEKAGVVKGAEGEMHPVDVLPPISATTNALRRILKFATNQKSVDAMVEKALLVPAFAAELLAQPTPARLSRLKSTIGTATVGAALGAEGQQQ